MVLSPQLPGGWYLLGEPAKWVAVSPQRFIGPRAAPHAGCRRRALSLVLSFSRSIEGCTRPKLRPGPTAGLTSDATTAKAWIAGAVGEEVRAAGLIRCVWR